MRALLVRAGTTFLTIIGAVIVLGIAALIGLGLVIRFDRHLDAGRWWLVPLDLVLPLLLIALFGWHRLRDTFGETTPAPSETVEALSWQPVESADDRP